MNNNKIKVRDIIDFAYGRNITATPRPSNDFIVSRIVQGSNTTTKTTLKRKRELTELEKVQRILYDFAGLERS